MTISDLRQKFPGAKIGFIRIDEALPLSPGEVAHLDRLYGEDEDLIEYTSQEDDDQDDLQCIGYCYDVTRDDSAVEINHSDFSTTGEYNEIIEALKIEAKENGYHYVEIDALDQDLGIHSL